VYGAVRVILRVEESEYSTLDLLKWLDGSFDHPWWAIAGSLQLEGRVTLSQGNFVEQVGELRQRDAEGGRQISRGCDVQRGTSDPGRVHWTGVISEGAP
jgi:hypothetical protein